MWLHGPGLFYRLREAQTWLARVLAQLLGEHLPQVVGGWPVRAVDATVINGPGGKAVQWRAHVLVNPSTGSFRSMELTDDSGGEQLAHYPLEKGELVLGGRAYGTARGVHAVRQAEAHVVAQFNRANLRTCDTERHRIYLKEQEAEVPITGGVEFSITIPVPPKPTQSHKIWDSSKAIAWIPARAVASRTRSGDCGIRGN
jgi:hypothetical protein